MLGAFDMLFDGASDKYDQVRKLHHAYHNCKSFLRKMRREQDSDHCTECDDADQEPKLKELTRHRTRPRSGSYIRMRRPQPAEQSDSKDDCSTCAENNPSTGRYRGRRRSRHDHPHDRQSIRLPFRENRERAARFSFDSDYHGHRGRAASRSKDRHSHTRHELRGRRRSPALETAPRECDCPECSQSKSHRQSAERSQPCQKHHHQHHGKSNSLELDIEAYRHSHENPGCLKPIARPSRNQKERRASDCSCSECAKLARHTTRHSQKSCDFGDQETCTDHRYALGNQKEIHSVRSRRGESPKLRNSYGAVAQGAHQGAPSIILNVNQPSCKGEHPACKACNNHSNGCYVISNGERVPHNCRRPQTHAPDTEHTSRGASVHGHSQNGCRNFSGHSHHHHSDRSDRQPSGSFHCCSHAGDVTHNCGSEHRCNASGSNAGNCGNDTHHTQQATNESEWNKPVSHQSFTGGTGDKKSQGDWDQTKAEPQSWNVNDNSGSGNGGQGDWPPNDAAGDPGGVQGDSSWNHNGNPSWDNNNGSNQADPDWNGGNNPSWGTNNGGNQADSGWENGNNNAPNNSSWDSGNGDNQQSTSWDNNGNNGGDWQNENGNNQNNDQQDNWANSSNNNNNSNDNSWEIAKDASLNQDQLPQENQHEISNTGENNADVNSNNRKSTSSAAEVSQQPTRQIHWILPQPYRFAMPTQQPVLPPLVYHDPQNDEPPLYTVPEAVAQAESLSHQVQVGRAENYIHKLRVPHYLDTMEEPYAKFVFRYRVQGKSPVKLKPGYVLTCSRYNRKEIQCEG